MFNWFIIQMWQDVDKKKKKKYINKFATITLFNNYYIKNTTENTLLNVTDIPRLGEDVISTTLIANTTTTQLYLNLYPQSLVICFSLYSFCTIHLFIGFYDYILYNWIILVNYWRTIYPNNVEHNHQHVCRNHHNFQ